MNDNNNSSSGSSSAGIGFCSVLGIVFIVLKLIGKISWSWAWVLAPIWIPAVIWICVFVFLLIVYGR